MTHYLAIDIETTGPGVYSHRIVALGAALIDTKTGKVVSKDGTFRALMPLEDHTNGKPAEWDERTYVEFWTNTDKRKDGKTPLQAIQDLGTDPKSLESERSAAMRFVSWAALCFARFSGAVVITDTASFDTTFVNFLLNKYTDVPNLIFIRGAGKYRPVRDVSSFHMGIAMQTPARGLFESNDAAAGELGLVLSDVIGEETHDHDPLNDATYIGRVAATIAKAVDARVAGGKRKRQ